MVAGDKRRKVEDTKPLLIDHLDKTLATMTDDPRAQRLIALLYLSGRRANEIVALKKEDLKLEEHRMSFETFNEKVYRSQPTADFTYRRDVVFRHARKDEGGKIIHPRTYEFISTTIYNQRIRPHWRTDIGAGLRLTKYLTNTLAFLGQKDYLFPRLKGGGHIHYGMLYTIIRFYLPDAWPHLLRHERFTEVVKAYSNNPVASHTFTFHKRFESTLQYVRAQEEEKI